MKRFHVHIHVADLAKSVAFYSKMLGADPIRREADYAKWHVDEPALNLAISTRGTELGVDHLGFQVDSDEALAEMKSRAQAADIALADEGATTCCYARSDKYWVTDPDGVAWEQFHTLDGIPTFSESKKAGNAAATASACCAPSAPRGKPVGVPVQAVASSCC